MKNLSAQKWFAVLIAGGALLGSCINPLPYDVTPLPQEQILELADDHTQKDSLGILVFGDAGRDNDVQEETAKMMLEVCGERGCDFAMGMGDNFYADGVADVNDPEFEERFEEHYRPLGDIDFWMVLGNHDWAGNAQAQIDYTLLSDRWRMPAIRYPIVKLPDWVTIVAFDSQNLAKERELPGLAVEAMNESFCSKPDSWHLAFAHHPAYSSDSVGDDDVREVLRTVHADCGLDVYFSGHDHHQEHLKRDGFVHIIEGAAARVDSVEQGPYSLFADADEGFAHMVITEQLINITFFGEGGEIYSAMLAER